MKPKYVTGLDQVAGLTAEESRVLHPVVGRFEFRASDYYLSLIDWDDPDDPLRRIVVPSLDELDHWGRLDPSSEETYQVAPGVQHKYNSTALLLASDMCGGLCRFCFRKRLFIRHGDDVSLDVSHGLDYIRRHPEINNVLITGGDSLMIPTRRLRKIIHELRRIDHVRVIRLGTKMPAYNPHRILNDPDLIDLVRRYSLNRHRLYFMLHFNHWRELTDQAVRALALLQGAGAILCNQTPLIRGVNDDPRTMSRLLNELSYLGVPPYYVFQCRPTIGNKTYAVPVEEGYRIFDMARVHSSGLAKRARFVMSHAEGKIEVVGLTEEHVFFKFHRAAEDEDSARFMIYRRNPQAYWFDDYSEVVAEEALDWPPALVTHEQPTLFN
ncbi:MAG: KamA family radical SAM protein [Proteobacteria bacterium]|nr:KamA family radical SAM protein [Pseudomonadota bacterium]MBU1741753.1 KamA family radical SAM protein [Pseudomonadota bacterium]